MLTALWPYSVRSDKVEANLTRALENGPSHDEERIRDSRDTLQEKLLSPTIICSICNDTLVDPRITPCNHVFCAAW